MLQWGKEQEWRGLTVPFIFIVTMVTEVKLRDLIEGYTNGTTKFLVHLSVSASGNITVEMDGDDGFTIADCILLSKQIEQHLNRDEEDFSLEVASYGVGNPLLLPRQYIKNTGRLLQATTLDQAVIHGRIKSADEQGVELEILPVKGKKGVVKKETAQQIRLPYADISRAIIEVEF